MDIKKVDKNFVNESVESDGMRYYDASLAPFELYGIDYDDVSKQYVRMPTEIAENVSDGVAILNTFTAGGRVKFSTNSKKLNLKVEMYFIGIMANMPLSGSSGFCLCEEKDDGAIEFVSILIPESTDKNGYERSAILDNSRVHNYILYFPLYNGVKSLHIGLDCKAKLSGGKKYSKTLPILYYGSSITQGGCASRPDNSYQALISKWKNIDFINLGFSGCAKAEVEIVDYLATIKASIFVCDYDHNADNAKFLSETHYNLYARYRSKNKFTPIIFVTKPDFYRDLEGAERVAIIKATYEKAKASNDDNVYFIHGKDLFGDEDRDSCAVDGCHPNDLGFYRMAKVIGKQIDEILAKS